MSGDWLQSINHICNELLRAKGDVFLNFGFHIVTGLAVIRLVLFGLGCTFNAIDGRVGMDWGGLTKHILVIGCAYTMLRGYNAPVLGLADSFPDLIMNGPLYLAHQIGDSSFKQLDDTFKVIQASNPPSVTISVSLAISQGILDLSITLVRAIMLVVMSYGFVAVAVCVLVGPVFIPFLLFEPLSFMFWGWFKSFVQYSFYPVIGAAYTHIYASLLVNLIDKTTTAQLLLAAVPLLVMTAIGMLHAPQLCASLFAGSAGDHHGMAGAALKVAGIK